MNRRIIAGTGWIFTFFVPDKMFAAYSGIFCWLPRFSVDSVTINVCNYFLADTKTPLEVTKIMQLH